MCVPVLLMHRMEYLWHVCTCSAYTPAAVFMTCVYLFCLYTGCRIYKSLALTGTPDVLALVLTALALPAVATTLKEGHQYSRSSSIYFFQICPQRILSMWHYVSKHGNGKVTIPEWFLVFFLFIRLSFVLWQKFIIAYKQDLSSTLNEYSDPKPIINVWLMSLSQFVFVVLTWLSWQE